VSLIDLNLLDRLRASSKFLDRHPWFLPVFGLVTGVGSFVLVKRGNEVAVFVAAFIVSGWVWLMVQPLVREWLCRRGSKQISLTLVNLVTQSIQQEQLFFALPFLFLSTQKDDPSQLGVTALVAIAAVVATWDPFYMHFVARRYFTRVGFQCFCSFITAMTVLPVALGLPLERSFLVALFFVMLWMFLLLPFCWRRHKRVWQQAALVVVIPVAFWGLRSHIPPAGLEVKQVTLAADIIDHAPLRPLQNITLSELQRGVYLHAAIAAPLGLRQDIVFDWRHDDFSEQIVATITGGRREGYRTYAHKKHFMDASLGHWEVDILTPQGQLLKRVSFEVGPG
jgi:hypothetical protein